ncbi:MAG: tyrosine-type recombinase/integrase [Candidatus Didemnitutus sp.]|nr:tyrosine-type recombinase/integrase [Candidatus Didemnitutus sp.]
MAKHDKATLSRFHVDHWKDRLYRKTYTRNGRKYEVPEWSVRLQHVGLREAFALGTANASVAAIKAKEIAGFLDANGWDATLAKYKPRGVEACKVTVGDFLADVAKRSHLRPMTQRRYAVKLRKMVADIAGAEKGLKSKERLKKYDYATGGRAEWLKRVDALTLAQLTPDSVNAWRNAYVARARSEPVKRKSAERSAASYLRCVRALFSPDVVNALSVQLPPNPFAGVKLKDPGPQRYVSDVNPEWLLAVAERELLHSDGEDDERAKKRQQYMALFLCLWAGLRRKEADLLTWEQVDLGEGQIHVRRTAYFEPKTEESVRVVDLAPEAAEVLRSFKKDATSEFVLDGAEPDTSATYDYYRCDCTWRFLNAWLKGKGIRQPKAVHSLRKESGSLIASAHGIEAARYHLGHRDIRTTSAHYVGKKKRVEVRISLSSIERTA